MTRVKICGITNLEDAMAAVSAGADALGFVFYAKSPRSIGADNAAEIIAKLPPFVTTTALFVNADPEYVCQVIDSTQIDLLQFHGDETPDYCAQFNRPYIKAIRMRDDVDLLAEEQRFSSARALLLDAYKKGVPGGTGESFEWQRIPESLRSRIILAGGLKDTNIEQAICSVQPYAVDVSGGVEREHGIKDHAVLSRFMTEVRRADLSLASLTSWA